MKFLHVYFDLKNMWTLISCSVPLSILIVFKRPISSLGASKSGLQNIYFINFLADYIMLLQKKLQKLHY